MLKKTATVGMYLTLACLLSGATYHVAPDGDDTTGDGTPAKPWRTINHGAQHLAAGDTLLVHGGVYYEEVAAAAKGTPGQRITFKAYPGEVPVIDGSVAVTGLTPCASASDFVDHQGAPLAGGYPGNPNYASIYKAQVPAADVTLGHDQHYVEQGAFLGRSSLPVQANKVIDDYTTFTPIHPDSYGAHETVGNVTYHVVYDYDRDEPDGFWNGATMRVFQNADNANEHRATVVDWNKTQHRFLLAGLSVDFVGSGTVKDCYKLENHWALITEGTAYHTTAPVNGYYTVYVWPRNPSAIASGIRVIKHDRGFDFPAAYDDYITVDGFTVRNFARNSGSGAYGSYAIGNRPAGGYAHTGLRIENCTIHNVSGFAAISLWAGTEDVVDRNSIDNARSGYGIAVRGVSTNRNSHCKVTGNRVDHIRSTSLKINYADYLQISGNTVGASGSHGNGCSLYQKCDNVLVAGNVFDGSTSGVVMQASSNIYVFGNLFNCRSLTVMGWASSTVDGAKTGITGEVHVLQNTIQTAGDYGLGCSPDGLNTAAWSIANNIVDGYMQHESSITVPDRSYNLYTDYTYRQAGAYGWSLGPGEIHDEDYAAIFTDRPHDYTLVDTSSPAYHAGKSLALYITALQAKFPDYDFTADLYGFSFATPPSMGAIEYGSTPPDAGAADVGGLDPDGGAEADAGADPDGGPPADDGAGGDGGPAADGAAVVDGTAVADGAAGDGGSNRLDGGAGCTCRLGVAVEGATSAALLAGLLVLLGGLRRRRGAGRR